MPIKFEIAVEITDQNTETPVRIRKPSFKSSGNTLPGIVGWLKRQLLRGALDRPTGQGQDGAQARNCVLLVHLG